MKGIPTASVTGQDGWEWNRRYADPPARDTRPRSDVKGVHESSETEHSSHQPERCDVTPCGFELLESELDRKDRQRQLVIDRYEHLLRDRNREIERHDRNNQDDILSRVLRLMFDP